MTRFVRVTSGLSTLGHLSRRLLGMLSHRPVADADRRWANEHMLEAEARLWSQLSTADQRHSVIVARRFVEATSADIGEPSRDDVAAAILHDIGKLRSGMGPWSRVAATVVGPRTERFRAYHDHERIGAQMLHAAGSSARTVSLVDGTSPDRRTIAALRHADDI